ALLDAQTERRLVLRLSDVLDRAVGQGDRVDAVIQVRRLALEHDLGQQTRVEAVVSISRRVADVAGDLRRRSSLLAHRDRFLKCERLNLARGTPRRRRLRAKRAGQRGGKRSQNANISLHMSAFSSMGTERAAARAGRDHSYRRQTIGSCLAALDAGMMPNTSPTATDTPNATTTDIGETIVWMCAMR